jgi:succinylglutamic semialdehyde dehydrogenase
LLFTGSAQAGRVFRRAFADRPHVILALELGGNNPLIAWDGEPEAVASLVSHSAFITTGQRCSCARRLILPTGTAGDRMLEAVLAQAATLPVSAWDEEEGFMGPLISARAAAKARGAVAALTTSGAKLLLPPAAPRGDDSAFMGAAVLEVTGIATPDEEIFAPVLQVIRADSFDAAIAAANNTSFGLSAGLIAQDAALWERFASEIRAGVVNWNRPTTGAASAMPLAGWGFGQSPAQRGLCRRLLRLSRRQFRGAAHRKPGHPRIALVTEPLTSAEQAVVERAMARRCWIRCRAGPRSTAAAAIWRGWR